MPSHRTSEYLHHTSPNPGPVKDNLNGVTALSPTDAWAVGDYCVHSGCSFRDTLTLHWDGTAWSQVASPTPSSGPQNYLSGVAATRLMSTKQDKHGGSRLAGTPPSAQLAPSEDALAA